VLGGTSTPKRTCHNKDFPTMWISWQPCPNRLQLSYTHTKYCSKQTCFKQD